MYANTQSPKSGLPDPVTDPQFYSGVPTKRLIAWVIDTFLIAAVSMLILISTLFLTLPLIGLIFLAVHLFYRISFLAKYSATPGMQFAGIEFRDHYGKRFDGRAAALHTIAYTFVVGLFVTQLISMILMLTSSRAQGLHDHLLGTTAINRPLNR